jgi:hypothetical protein
MRFVVTLDCDNDAFSPNAHTEVVRILRHLADKLEVNQPDAGTLADANGNTVGSFAYLP